MSPAMRCGTGLLRPWRGAHLDRGVHRAPLEVEAVGGAVVVGEVADKDVAGSAVRGRCGAPDSLGLAGGLAACKVVIVSPRKEHRVKARTRRQQARLNATGAAVTDHSQGLLWCGHLVVSKVKQRTTGALM